MDSVEAHFVGRTPWSAAGPLAGFRNPLKQRGRQVKAAEGVGRGPGVRPTNPIVQLIGGHYTKVRIFAMLLALALGLLAQAPEQPIAYSHKTHVALGLKCRDCHPNPDPGEHMTFPATSKCLACHTTIAKDKPAIQKLAGFAK